MKFGSQLQGALYREWQEYYLDYTGLKKRLKRGEKQEGGYTEKDESEFVEHLDKELEKIYAFQNSKIEEIKDRVHHCENAVASITRSPSMNVPDIYTEVENEINAITEELNELAKYARLNYTGIIKIVKKHDRRTRYILRPMFNVRLNACPFYKETYEPIIVQLSKLYHIVHTELGYEQGSNIPPSPVNFSLSSSWKPPTFLPDQRVRQNHKFWVHPNNIMEVKTTILRHLPVLIYKAASEPSVSTIYFDNQNFELYQDKVDRKGGEQIIRIRWYGNRETTNEAFVERKIHQQGEEEIKDRFAIKEKYIVPFLKGEYSMQKTINKMKEAPVKKEEDIKQFEKLVSDIQSTILEKNLKPVLRTNYNRMAFQIPGDSRCRISLDTDFVSIREDNFDGVQRRKDGEWRRTDIEDDQNSFNKLPASEVSRFPYAVLEIKLKLEENEQEPAWIRELIESHLVEEAPQFSKFVHGVATMFTSQAPSLPFWLPNVDKDILKPPSNVQSTSSTSPMVIPSNGRNSNNQNDDFPRRRSSASKLNYVEVVVDNDNKRKGKGKAVDNQGQEEEPNERTALLGNRNGKRQKTRGFLPNLFDFFNQTFKTTDTEPVTLPPAVRVPQKVETPIRVEAKVYFANERTFFSWLRFSLLLGTFSVALFNAGTNDNIGRFCGLLYSTISVMVLIYALSQYHKRVDMINSRHAGPYDDLVFPTVVCFALFFAVSINFFLKLAPAKVERGGANVGQNNSILI
ncbi:14189_t:CDS:2 [Ambispora leptoticha]|uniref:14189_t:CDS:1 n=1 Tax=Ambispora leptoticha TaxID=144679 RepID=A0A9N9FKG1_9GLOM|nr:14189_t:CDS:2 [Ambispora leptoticha]